MTGELNASGSFAGYSNGTCFDGPYHPSPKLVLPTGVSVSFSGGGVSGCSSGNDPISGTATISISPQFKFSSGESTFSVYGAFEQTWTYFNPNPPGQALTTPSEQLGTYELPIRVFPIPFTSPTPLPCQPSPAPSSVIIIVRPRHALPQPVAATPGPCSSQPAPSATPYLAIVEEAVPKGQPTFVISAPYPGPSPIAVGQQVRLGVREIHGDPVSNITWSVPQPIVYGFNESAAAHPIETFPPNAWHEPNVYYYWTQANNAAPKQTVWVTGTVKGMRLTSVTTYDVYTINNVKITGVLGNVASDEADYTCVAGAEDTAGYTWLHIGYPCGSGAKGILWKYTASSPSVIPVGGLLELFQMIAGSSGGQPVGSGPPPRRLVVLPFGVDNAVPYNLAAPIARSGSAVWTDSDDPGSAVSPSYCTQLQISQNFTDFFMYRPNASEARPSIPVDIGVLTWNWNGATTYSAPQNSGANGTWQLTSSSKAISNALPLAPVMPSWNRINPNNGGSAC